ncbi:hypothetical protein [Demequina sp.]|uniref:hypothetical protein n=1 Tax=Demequina sp. TaxID=2050685 RepID=UPI003D0FC360
MKNRLRALGALTILALGVAVATPASADPPVGCITAAYLPLRDGDYVKARTVLTCPSGYGLIASYAESRAQESVLGVWTTRKTQNGTSTTTTNTVIASYNCNGHGTDSYRTRGDGTDNFTRSSTTFSPSTGITC